MTTFKDGPAAGKSLMLKRAPVFLRVVIDRLGGKIDALDQLEDAPDPNETLFAYRITGKPGVVHLKMGKENGVNRSGFYPIAEYALCESQPSDGEMRSQAAWRDWCNAHAETSSLPSPA